MIVWRKAALDAHAWLDDVGVAAAGYLVVKDFVGIACFA
jgi:hypothetical protein